MTSWSTAFSFLLCAALLVLSSALGGARAAPLDTIARYAVLMDSETGEILFAKDGDELMVPSSMSKLMTIEVLFDALKKGSVKLDDKFHVSPKAWKVPSNQSKMFTRVDTDIPVEALIQGIVVVSGNDACVVVAEGMAGSESAFAERMTQRAREIGLTRSIFANSTGLPDPGHLMTARELAVLARHLITAYPEYYHYFAEREFTWERITQPNRLPALEDEIGVDGLKTGHTEEAGYGLVASALQNGRRLILVLNGLSSEKERGTEAKRLLTAGFREFNSYDLVLANQIVGTAPVFGGAAKEVGLTVSKPVKRLLSRDARAGMKVTLDFTAPLKAPVKAGTKVGTLTVTVPDSSSTSVDLVTNADVGRIGPLGALGLGLKHLFFGEAAALPPPSTLKKKQGAAKS
jgi:D-alanyl-D-alanine carboxypeptidase (penicillin-binding protein 5/6)